MLSAVAYSDEHLRINTQEQLLASERDVRRIIEIGPAGVLAPMAKKSAKKLVGEKDVAQSIEREFLSITNADDARKIYYDYDGEITSIPKEESATSAPSQPPSTTPVAAPAQIPQPPPAAVASLPPTAATIIDRPLTPTDVVIALVAQKLRRAFDEVPLGESIQALSGGEFSESISMSPASHNAHHAEQANQPSRMSFSVIWGQSSVICLMVVKAPLWKALARNSPLASLESLESRQSG